MYELGNRRVKEILKDKNFERTYIICEDNEILVENMVSSQFTYPFTSIKENLFI